MAGEADITKDVSLHDSDHFSRESMYQQILRPKKDPCCNFHHCDHHHRYCYLNEMVIEFTVSFKRKLFEVMKLKYENLDFNHKCNFYI